MNTAEAWAILEAEYSTPPDQPEGSFTVQQYVEARGIPPTSATRLLERMLADGKVTAVQCMTVSKNGRRVKSTAYLPVVKGPQ